MALYSNYDKLICCKCSNDKFEIVELFKFYKDIKTNAYEKQSLGLFLKCNKCGETIPYNFT